MPLRPLGNYETYEEASDVLMTELETLGMMDNTDIEYAGEIHKYFVV